MQEAMANYNVFIDTLRKNFRAAILEGKSWEGELPKILMSHPVRENIVQWRNSYEGTARRVVSEQQI